jgi:hypothetical protein
LGPWTIVNSTPVTLFQVPEAAALDRRVMHEHIRTVRLLDEAETLGPIEPLHDTLNTFSHDR